MRRGVIRLGDQIKDIWFRDITSRIPPISTALYIVYTDGSKYYAKNGDTGMIEFVDTDISNLLQNVINALYQRYGGGRIFIKRGIYYPTKSIIIPDGMKLIVEGEENNTIFRYTDSYILFYHDPYCIDDYWLKQVTCTQTTPSWSSVVVFRNLKIDRSGSGSNSTNIFHLFHGKVAIVDGVEIVDDYRSSPSTGDAGIQIINNIVGIVENCRIYNKFIGIEAHAFLSIVRDNYVENTGATGIMGAGLITTNWTYVPPGYNPGGISIIENNVCVDCGQIDEAIAIDFHGETKVNPVNALGIIRGNLLTTRNGTMRYAIVVVASSHAIVEGNKVEGNVAEEPFAVAVGYKGKYLVLRNNVFNVNATTTKSWIETRGDVVIVENNDINFNTSLNQNTNFKLVVTEANYVVVRNNRITVSLPSGYMNNNVVEIVAGTDPNYFAVIEGNYINAPSNPSNIFVFIGSVLTINHYIVFTKNILNSSTYNGGFLTLGTWGSNNITFNAIVKDNIVLGSLTNKVELYAMSTGMVIAYLDTDVQPYIRSNSNFYYIKRNSDKATFSGDGTTTQFKIPHRLISTPTKIQITPGSSDAEGSFYVTADSTYIYVNYATAPPVGTNNIVLYWYAEV